MPRTKPWFCFAFRRVLNHKHQLLVFNEGQKHLSLICTGRGQNYTLILKCLQTIQKVLSLCLHWEKPNSESFPKSFYKYFSWRQKCRHHFKKYFVSMWVDGRIAVTFQTPFTCLELEGSFTHPNFKKISDNKKCPPVWESKYKSKTIVLLIHNSVGFFIDSYWQDYPLWFIIWA